NYLAAVGRFDEAVGHARHGLELDPLALPVILNTAFVLHLARRIDEARSLVERALELDPGFLHVHYHLGLVHEQMGLHTVAIENFTKSIGRGPGTIAALGRAYGLAGDRARARACLDELQQLTSTTYVSPYDVALVCLALG